MPLNKLENFLKNVEGRILYVSPADLDSTDSILNQGNSQTKPFKTLQRALIEAARFSYNVGRNNDTTEKTTILLMPGEHEVDNRPGHTIRDGGGAYQLRKSDGSVVGNETLNLALEANFDINQEDNVLYKFNSVHGGVIVPRGTSIVGLDLRKTKIRPKYVPNPTDDDVPYSAVFRITGACYFWQFSIFDGNELGKVYTDNRVFVDTINQVQPTFSHHKLTCFEYADGVNDVQDTGLTDLDMYYYKLSRAYNAASNRNIAEKFLQNGSGTGLDGFSKQRPEWEIVGAFANDPITITKIQSGSLPGVPTNQITVTTQGAHNLSVGTPIKIKGVSRVEYNISTKVASTDPVLDNKFTYVLPDFPLDLETEPAVDGALITIETDTVSGASPYIFNISLRSVWGMNGMHADGSKASGFRSMVVAQFTGVSLQKDDRAFVKYNSSSRVYEGIPILPTKGTQLALKSSSTNASQIYHLDSNAIYRKDWQTTHVKITNDAILQIVSVFAIGYANHFLAESGGDASITNSNSNFGQLALVADGFRKDAFKKDDNAFITHIIAPKAINSKEEDIEWLQISAKTDTNNNRLYLFGYSENGGDKPHSKDIKPPFLTQGFRIGAKVGEKLYAKIDGFPGDGPDGTSVADIFMSRSVTNISAPNNVSGRRIINVKSINGIDGTFETITQHFFGTGEKIIINADDGDLPENIEEHKVYFAITANTTNGLTSNKLRLALSESDAKNGVAIRNTYSNALPEKIKITTRVTDKEAGELGHPVQYDPIEGWYITTNPNSQIRERIIDQRTAANVDPDDDIEPIERTDISFFFRTTDTRSLDDKIFKTRVSIPREVQNGKNIQNGFVLQESSSVNVRTPEDFAISYELQPTEGNRDLTESDHDFDRNLKFISNCTFIPGSGGQPGKVTVTSERPHNLKTGDLVKIEGITDTVNTGGDFNKGYNIEAIVTVEDESLNGDKNSNMVFSYDAPLTISTPPTNNFGIDKTQFNLTSSIPRFTRKNLQSNLYFYRNDVVSEYKEGIETGVYHAYQLFADLKVPTEFTENKYGQTVVDLYPQLDRDNQNDTPRAAKSFALRSPLGKVVTNDLQNSITRESIDKLLVKFGFGLEVRSFIDSGNVITLKKNHNLCGMTKGIVLVNNNGLSNGVYENVKIFEGPVSQGNWNGTLARFTISSNQINENTLIITNPGSGFNPGSGSYGFFDNTLIGGPSDQGGVKIGRTGSNTLRNKNFTSTPENLVVQITGSGVREDVYFRTTSVPQPNQIGIAKTPGDPKPALDQYAFIVGSALECKYIGGSADSDVTIETKTWSDKGGGDRPRPHGLKIGNKFQLNDINNNNLGTFIVSSVPSADSFTFKRGDSNLQVGPPVNRFGYILRHGLSANDADTGKGGENLSVRGVPLYGLEEAQTSATINSADVTEISLISFEVREPSPSTAQDFQQGMGVRFPKGSYIQIDDEILRIASDTNLQGGATLNVKVIRGVFGTQATSHPVGSLAIKLNPIPLELHRYSILRASGHTFEYLGYGPGNYSTALPQVQVKTLTESEEFLSQAQEREAGSVVYTGMNDKGDFYIGNQKKSALTGEETTFDNPVPTVAGEDPSRLSVVFDEVTIKERLVVEGGRNNNILSQFDGPVNFNQNVRFGTDSRVTIKNETSADDGGALTVDGGVQIDENLNVDGTGDFDRVTIQKDLRVGIGSDDTEQLDAIILGRRKHIVFDNKSELGPDNDGFRIFVNATQNAIVKNETRRRDVDGNVLFDEEGAILGRDINIMTRKNSDVSIGLNGAPFTAQFTAAGSSKLYWAGNSSLEAQDDVRGSKLRLETTGVGVTVIGSLFVDNQTNDPLQYDAINLKQSKHLVFDNKSGLGELQDGFRIFVNNNGNAVIKNAIRNGEQLGNGGYPGSDLNIMTRSQNHIQIGLNGAPYTARFTAQGSAKLYYAGLSSIEGGLNSSQLRLETNAAGGNLIATWNLSGRLNVTKLGNDVNNTTGVVKADRFEGRADEASRVKIHGANDYGAADAPDENEPTKMQLVLTHAANGVNRLFTKDNLEYNRENNELKVPGDLIAFASDDRLKTNRVGLIDSLNKVCSLNGFTFNFNEIGGKLGFDTEIDYVGVSAQEVQKVLPEAVKPAQIDNAYQTVQYEKLVPLLIEAIKELSDKVDYLEQKLSDK